MRKTTDCQILIAGGGITGLTLARELVHRGLRRILIIEKERELGCHASGRNSGVLHAGIYYAPDTLKARFCLEGNRLMKSFCKEKGLALHEAGKVIVARTEEELGPLHELKARADSVGAATELIDEARLAEIEPHAATHKQALYSPETAVIRPLEVVEALANELKDSGNVEIWHKTSFLAPGGGNVAQTSRGDVRYELFVNAAGAYADRMAHQFGLGKEYRILPFKGTYKRLRSDRSYLVNGSIYPVPDLRTPFLGVHFTRSVEAAVHIGPTAIPALGRENYGLLDGISPEAVSIVLREMSLFFRNAGFRTAALTEPKRYFTRFVYQEAKRLVPSLELRDIESAGKVGIRPQLVHWPSRKLAMDFVVLGDESSLHVLNAISPAFTSSMSFAKELAAQLLSVEGVALNALPV